MGQNTDYITTCSKHQQKVKSYLYKWRQFIQLLKLVMPLLLIRQVHICAKLDHLFPTNSIQSQQTASSKYMTVQQFIVLLGFQHQVRNNMSINTSINQRFSKWPKWYATARNTTGNKTVETEMS